MRKVIYFAVIVFSAICLLASFAQAGRNEDDKRFITEEQWTESRDGKKIFVRERIATNAMEDVGELPKLAPPSGDQIPNPRPGVERRPVEKAQQPTRTSADLSRDKGRVVSGQRIAPPPAAVPYHLEKGETVSNLDRFTEKPSTNAILKATGKTPAQAKKMKVDEPAFIPEKRLKQDYRDPLKRIDQLREEIKQLEDVISKLEKINGARVGQVKELENRIKELEARIAQYEGNNSQNPVTLQPKQEQPAPADVAPKTELKKEFKGKYNNAVFTFDD